MSVRGRSATRAAAAVVASLLFHAALVGAVVGVAAWRGWQLARPLNLQPITVTEIKELPLGGAPAQGPDRAATEGVAKPAPRPRPRPVAQKGNLAVAGADAGAPSDAAPGPASPRVGAVGASRRSGDLRAYGPEGSRLTALLRLDRLRVAPGSKGTIAALDELLKLLPDRRRLIEGTGLDLYRDFDALLIATPNPMDDAVTFLAARHKMSEPQIRAALDRGAAARGRPITWSVQGGRVVGVRQVRPGMVTRDDRIFVLPQTGLAVMAPPAYGKLLLEDPRAGAIDGGAPRKVDFRELIARIDAEDGAMPDDAVLMATVANLLKLRGDDANDAMPAGGAMPRLLTIIVGFDPSTFIDIRAEFARVADAEAWQAAFPAWKAKALANPVVLLAGLNGILNRAELTRDNRTILLRTTASVAETQRILQMAAGLVGGARGF